MARGGSRNNNNRGRNHRGGPRSRGSDRGRNRGGYGGGRGRGGSPPLDFDIVDYPVQIFTDYNGYDSNRGSFSPPNRGGRGRGFRGRRGSTPTPGTSTPTRGNNFYQGRGRTHTGIGSPTQQVKPQTGSKLGQNAPLSTLLYETRPLLRPVIFVRSTTTPFLFQQGEELLKPVVEDVGDVEENHIPTANCVARVFSGMALGDAESANSDDENLEEIDFNNMEKLLDVAAKPIKKSRQMDEEQFTGSYNRDALTTHQQKAATHEDIPPSGIDVFEERIVEIPISSPLTPNKRIQHPLDVLLESLAVAHEPGAAIRPPSLETQAFDDVLYMGKEAKEHLATAETSNDVAEQSPQEWARRSSEAFGTADAAPSPLGAAIFGSQYHRPGPGDPVPLFPKAAEASSFFIDTTPATIGEKGITSGIRSGPEVLGDDDDVIVYVAPHPRSGRTTPAVTDPFAYPSALPTTSILTGLPTINESSPFAQADISSANAHQDLPPQAPTLAARFSEARKPRQFVSPLLLTSPRTQNKAKMRVRRHEARLARKGKGKQSMLSFAAARQDMEWKNDLEERDPRWDERRKGDSDIDWGDDGQDEEAPTSRPNDMDVDPELLDEKSLAALGSFADGILGQERSRFMTMDGIADADKLREEDEASQGGAEGSSEEDSPADENRAEQEEETSSDKDEDLEAALEEEELNMVAEDACFDFWDQDDDEDLSDDDLSPRSSFQTRLERLRKHTRMRRAHPSVELHLSSPEEDDEDDELIQHIEDFLSENQDILSGRDRKQKNRLFKAINSGNYDQLSEFTVVGRKKDKVKDLPLSLQQQWEKDREEKAEFKALTIGKIRMVLDPSTKKKGRKKGRKAMLAASRLDPQITVIGSNRVIDMTTLVQHIRRFLANPDGPETMALPPTNKYTRKLVHEMAVAFNMKSISKGSGDARYTTLIKTSYSGSSIDEKKISQIVRRSSGGAFYRGEDAEKGSKGSKGKGKGKAAVPLRQQEGEEVGKAAPKINSNNVGFKMLEAMGWSDGMRIGVTGGLDEPLTARIKHSKLGLGATR